MSDRRPGHGRYAHLEREQRWAVRGLPDGVESVSEITDRYVTGTRLRLRRAAMDGDVVFKLAQKVRSTEGDPEVVRLTNIYVSADEYAVLAGLPASELRKSRWRSDWCDHTVAIDQFHDRLEGLVLAEVELGPDETRLPSPIFATRDVTNDDRFSGGALATATDDEIARTLDEYRSWS